MVSSNHLLGIWSSVLSSGSKLSAAYRSIASGVGSSEASRSSLMEPIEEQDRSALMSAHGRRLTCNNKWATEEISQISTSATSLIFLDGKKKANANILVIDAALGIIDSIAQHPRLLDASEFAGR